MKSNIMRTIEKTKSILTTKLKEKTEFKPHYFPSKQIVSQVKTLKTRFSY